MGMEVIEMKERVRQKQDHQRILQECQVALQLLLKMLEYHQQLHIMYHAML